MFWFQVLCSAAFQGIVVNGGKQILSADSGGLLKIWDIAANECVTTVEAHDEKIWTMQVVGDESRFVTGRYSFDCVHVRVTIVFHPTFLVKISLFAELDRFLA